MNVIISNKYTAMLQSLDIDVIKSLQGEFDVDDIIAQFQNFFFQRMIIDITAIKNHKDIVNLQKLSISFDMDKIILLLDDDEESSSPAYLSKLISMGIYNFTKNSEGIMYLYNNPNSYRDVAHIHQVESPDISSPSKPQYGFHDGNKKSDGKEEDYELSNAKVIGIKNVTKQSGATTLLYMMKNELESHYSVIGIEVGKTDFKYFNNKSLLSISEGELENVLDKYKSYDVILVDVNESDVAMQKCDDIVYLIEPSIIKLNKLMILNRNILNVLKKGKKVILNQSMLSKKDVLDFEYESGLKIFYNLPALNEREKNNYALNSFLTKLGFLKQEKFQNEQEKRNKKFGLF